MGPARVAVLTFEPRKKGEPLDRDAITDAILRLRTRQVGVKMTALSLVPPELRGAAVVCRIHDFPSAREKRATTFDRRMDVIAKKIAKRFRCAARVEIELEIEFEFDDRTREQITAIGRKAVMKALIGLGRGR